MTTRIIETDTLGTTAASATGLAPATEVARALDVSCMAWGLSATRAGLSSPVDWYDADDGYDYERDPTPEKGTWHRIDWRRRMYQEIDAVSGERVSGGEGAWRRLR